MDTLFSHGGNSYLEKMGRTKDGGDTMKNELITAPEAAKLMKCSTSYAYKILAQIRKEMEQEGLITLQGRVPRQRLLRRIGLV